MKQLLLMFVLLISSFTNAQNFNFSCGPTAAETLKSERIMELEALGDGIVTLTVTITLSNGVVDGYKSSIYNDGELYDSYPIGTAIELQLKESFDNNVANMKGMVDGLISDNRDERLMHVQSLATGNIIITPLPDPTFEGDIFNVSHDGPNPSTGYNVRTKNSGGYIQELTASELSQFYNSFGFYITMVQGEYDADAAAAALIAKRNDFISQLEAEFLQYETSIISIELGKESAHGNDADVVYIRTIDPNIFSETPITGGLLEEGEQSDIDNMKTGLPALVNIVQTNFNNAQVASAEAVESFTGYTNDELDEEIDDLVNSNLTGGTKGTAIKGLFWDLVGQTTSSGKPIIDVTTTYAGAPDFYIHISIYTDVTSGSFITVLGQVNVYYSEITAEQLKYLYLDAATQAADL